MQCRWCLNVQPPASSRATRSDRRTLGCCNGVRTNEQMLGVSIVYSVDNVNRNDAVHSPDNM